jgi:LuxR family transcriptional regulator, maltose regulon positive regulatory protein
MSTPILATKLYIPPPRPNVVVRSRLIERLNERLRVKLSLVSAPAGFGKTTLVSEWVSGCDRPTAWLSLGEEDNDPTRFLTYFVAALQTIAPNIGEGVLTVLQSPQPPPTEAILTALLNEIATFPDDFLLVLDDYHLIDARPIDNALTFLLEHLPPQMQLVITTREDPNLPLARLRARRQLIELRAADLRFTPNEASAFLNQVMRLNLSADDIAALETRTEGWIAGLQLAAISMQGHQDVSSFIQSFSGSHHFVLDYLVEEVLQRQPENVQTFLLRTSILDRLCGLLCDAVLLDESASGQTTLEAIEHANLFLVPLDNERRWYRYHHLFADLLRQRLHQRSAAEGVAELHSRASVWYEDHGLELEAFHHAAAAQDVERVERLIEGDGMPLQFRSAWPPVLNWLESLPRAVLDARPSLWVTYASTLLFGGQQPPAVELKLQAAESALKTAQPNDNTADLIGRIASIRALLGVIYHNAETIMNQSRRALEYLHPDNVPVRTAATMTLGHAYQLQGNRAAARQAYLEVIALSNSSRNSIYTTAAAIYLGQLQEADNQLRLATTTYRRALQLAGDPPEAMVAIAYLGLARICYQWNDLEAAEEYGRQCDHFLRQMYSTDTIAAYDVFRARLKLMQGDTAGAVVTLAEAEAFVHQHNFLHQMPEVAATQVLVLLQQDNLVAAAYLAQTHDLPVSQARVYLAQENPSAALAVLEQFRPQMEAKNWADEQLRAMILEAIALYALGEVDKAVQVLGGALALAKPGGFIRLFIDEGPPMNQLLSEASARGMMPDYTRKLLAAFEAEKRKRKEKSQPPAPSPAQPLIEPLRQRELEILRLVAEGLSNREISERLFIALVTVKVHNGKIFEKLQVQRRTEAVARARELGLL